jgi:S-DNA-T family DNA segregation ATPase FtsK/SpoIIIE
VQVHPGPIITRFEIEPARGVKVSQIANLQDDLALAMKATAIRIIAPIPGRGAVGIEIPNEHPAIVCLRDVLAAEAYQQLRSEIPLALGKDTTGKVFCADLAKMPHLLVAGATGSGKSICLNALLTGMMFRSTPEDLRFLMIDPKRLELPRYRGIPHLISPVVTEARDAAMALQWLVAEMDRRYDILAALTVRDIYGFNRRIDEGEDLDALPPEERRRLPHIVVVVDEFADLMVRAPREVEAPVQRLAQMARAVGIHLVFATQRPSVDVITGVIKANFASRIAFRVISMTDSRTVLDRNGAETLLGNGDMLFLPTGKPDPIRLHGAFISPEETARLVSFLRKQGPPSYLFDIADKKSMGSLAAAQQDSLYEKALDVVVGTQMGSTSLLQRRLSVGYARAGRLMDLLESNGVVGPFKGSKARDVLVRPEYLETLRAGVAVAEEEWPGDDEREEPRLSGPEYDGPDDDEDDDEDSDDDYEEDEEEDDEEDYEEESEEQENDDGDDDGDDDK